MIKKRATFLTLIVIALLPSFASPCFAEGLYTDVGGGLSTLMQSSSFFTVTGGPTAPSQLSMALHLNLSLYADLDTNAKGTLVHLGFQHRYSTKTNAGDKYNLHASYLGLRLGVKDVYFGLGYAPFVFRSLSGAAGFQQGFGKVQGAYGLLGELGLLLPITPEAAFGFGASAETISSGGGQSPSPVISGIAFLRIYLIGSKSGVKRRGRGEAGGPYEPWRYPHGWMKND